MRRIGTVIAAMGLVACKSSAGDPLDPLPGSGIEASEAEYPEGEYGTTVGAIIRDYDFPGYIDPSQGMGEEHQLTLRLADFYNPNGDGTYDADDVFPEGEPKPRALMINVSALWCGPCQEEARTTLPEKYARYGPEGLQILMVLADTQTPGEPAGFTELDLWCTTFPVNYPAAIDPSYQLGALFDTSQFPANFIIDTRTMEIAEVVGGVPQDAFFQKLEAVLASD